MFNIHLLPIRARYTCWLYCVCWTSYISHERAQGAEAEEGLVSIKGDDWDEWLKTGSGPSSISPGGIACMNSVSCYCSLNFNVDTILCNVRVWPCIFVHVYLDWPNHVIIGQMSYHSIKIVLCMVCIVCVVQWYSCQIDINVLAREGSSNGLHAHSYLA